MSFFHNVPDQRTSHPAKLAFKVTILFGSYSGAMYTHRLTLVCTHVLAVIISLLV